MSDLADALLARRMKPGTLRAAHFQVADRCNHVCVHCYQIQGEKGELTTAEACATIDRLAQAGVFLLTISGGEATLRDDLLEIIRRARSHSMAVTLYTNAFGLDAEMARRLKELAVWRVHVSVYSCEPTIHDAVTGVRGSFERTLAGIRALRAAGLVVVMKTPRLSLNDSTFSQMESFAASLGCGLGVNEDLQAREDGDLGILRELQLPPTDAVDPTCVSELRTEARRPCSIGERAVVIEPNGEVRPCTAVMVGMGNAVRDDLEQLFRDEDMEFLRSITFDTMHGCRDCAFRATCGRCLGTAALEAGDALGPYPTACHHSLDRYQATVGRPIEVVGLRAARRIGPFRILGEGLVEGLEDVVTNDDLALVRRFPWLRPDADAVRSWRSAPGGQPLVQLHRKPRIVANPAPSDLEVS